MKTSRLSTTALLFILLFGSCNSAWAVAFDINIYRQEVYNAADKLFEQNALKVEKFYSKQLQSLGPNATHAQKR